MGIFSRFFAKKTESKQMDNSIVPNPDIENAISVSIVFSGALNINNDELLAKLKSIDPTIKDIRYETPFGQLEEGMCILVSWGKHVIRVFGLNAPYPKAVLETCVAPASYSQEIKQQVYESDSHLLLYYVGYEQNVLEQYLALTRLAVCFEQFNALAVINEDAHTSLPVNFINSLASEKDGLTTLGECLPLLFCGFVKYEIENIKGIWMRTYGANKFGLPNFAALANSYEESEYYFDMFSNILNYLRQSQATMNPGDTMEMGDNRMMSLRAPQDEEYFLKDQGDLLVIEINN
ncbi:DUF4261 domain-containing protein [Gilliamella sp. B14384H2]|uniref:DUF4261 domain-containing protein n=1 Tax=unclassified Gilliamella TaxID=2685620 RepID=UPI0018DCE3E6|nr:MULTISPECIES: DUF4261 domain-containing protein [unclassified Gilliamella]MBI0036674.1 DUF4261 domain-containing protein [Gilliamella sp. B14384G10]MBI0040715.1 DUF4261 domain-containing protein [Gilliamella sp. B14384G7]MBI0050669.1 DUF4261 domain-containing protein [Gilliamella sp. B14384G13]MBI0052961.1 DUF4261 domain-containing protein [Gilliamella sp. B14384H2]